MVVPPRCALSRLQITLHILGQEPSIDGLFGIKPNAILGQKSVKNLFDCLTTIELLHTFIFLKVHYINSSNGKGYT